LPCRAKLLLKRLKNFDTTGGTGEIFYTFLLWIETKGAPEEVREKLLDKIKHRIGYGEEEDFT
jgi:hypothetical protein